MPVFISFIGGTLIFHLFPFFPISCILIMAAAAVHFFAGKRLLLLPVIVLGIFYAFVRFSQPPDPQPLWNREIRMTGGYTGSADGGATEKFSIDEAFDEETGDEIEALQGREIEIFNDGAEAEAGRHELLVKTGRDRKRFNPGAYGDPTVYGSLIESEQRAEDHLTIAERFDGYRRKLNNYASQRFSADTAALVAAVTTGDKGLLSGEMREAFNASGLAHILSISGTHFGLFSLMVFGALVFLIRRLPYEALLKLTVYLSPPQAAALLCIPFMLFYLGLSGASVPAVRSFVMVSLFLAGLLLGRKGHWLNSLCFAAFVLVLWDPSVVLGLSFQLSFIAVLFIGFALGEKEEDDGSVPKNPFRFLIKPAAIALAASVGTAPLAAYYFHSFSLIAPLSNLLVTPLVGFVLVPLSLFSSFVFLALDWYPFSTIIGGVSDLSIRLVKTAAQIPHASMSVAAFPAVLCLAFYAGFLLYMIRGRRKEFLVVPFLPILIYLSIYAVEKGQLRITFLDVGQGDSSVVELPDNRTIVIDTGRTGREAGAYLKFRGRKDIDALVISHSHPDHSGGLQYLLERFSVREIWDNGLIEYPAGIVGGILHRSLGRGDILESGGTSIEVLHPYGGYHSVSDSQYETENDSSLVLRVKGVKNSILFAGDIEAEAEDDILHLGGRLRSDLLKVPHHGSRTSAGENFLSSVSSSYAVISVGRDNSFGHPSPEVIHRLGRARILRTNLDGAVRVTETAEGLEVKTYRDYALRRADGLSGEWENIRRLFVTW